MGKFCPDCGSPLSEDGICAACSAASAAADVSAEPTVDSIVEEVLRENQLQWEPEPAPADEPAPATVSEPVMESIPEPQIKQAGQPPVIRPPVYTDSTLPPQPPEEIPDAEPDRPEKKSKWEIMSSWGTVGALALMAIPGIGLILTIIWACGGCRKYAKRNLARALLLILLIVIVVLVIAGALTYLFVLRPILPEIKETITRVFEAIFQGFTITWN